MKNIAIAVAIIVAITACDRLENQPAETGSVVKNQIESSPRLEKREDSQFIQIPSSLAFSTSIRVNKATSWDDRLASLTTQEQALLRDVATRYYGAVKFYSSEEQIELAQNGFPMPEEWLAASQLTDDELKRQADAGNIKAQMFYSDRLGSRLMEMQATRKADIALSDEAQARIVGLASQALSSSAKLMKTSNSPFAAYVYGRSLSGSTPGAQPEAMAGAFFAARDRGDIRANNLMATFTRQNPGMNNQTIMSAYSAMTTLRSQ